MSTIQPRIDNGPLPDVFAFLDHFEQVVDQAENYASRKDGWFIPPTTGAYVFFTACDDAGRLYLSTDADPANKKLIASESNWSINREWTTSPGGSPVGETLRSL